MALLTLDAAREALWKYGSEQPYPGTATQRDEFDAKLNQVIEELLLRCKPRHTMRRVRIPIYDGNITLPRHMLSCSGVKLLANDEDECCGSPLLIYSAFHEFFHGACPACDCDGAAYPVNQLAQTFRDPDGTFKLRVKATEAGGNLLLIGGVDGSSNELFATVNLAITNGTTTTTQTYTALPQIQKPETDAKVELYSVDNTTAVETLIAIYAPGEEVPAYHRYTVTSTDSDAPACFALCKLAFVPVSADTDIVYPGVIRALKAGLKAVAREDKEEPEAAAKWWKQAQEALDLDRQQLDGDANFTEFHVLPGVGFGDIPATL